MRFGYEFLAVGADVRTVALEMLGKMVDDESGLLSVYYGSDVTEEQAQGLAARFTEKYPLVDVEVHNGGQPIYYYVVSVE